MWDLNSIITIFGILSKFDIKSIFKKIKSKNKEVINIFGTYDYFIKNLNSENCDLWILKNSSDNIHYKNIFEKIKNCNYYLECTSNYRSFIKKYMIFLSNYYKQRKDLPFFNKIYMSFKKANKCIYKTTYYCNLEEYFNNIQKHNINIKNLFDNKKINKIILKYYEKEAS